MSKVPHFLVEQLALLGLQPKVDHLKPLEQFPQVIKLLIEHLASNDHIIQTHQAGFISNALQGEFYQLLERHQSIAKAKVHRIATGLTSGQLCITYFAFDLFLVVCQFILAGHHSDLASCWLILAGTLFI
jgi:hypothetical protein